MISMMVERISPTIAKEYLLSNRNNYRKLSRPVVNRYAEDMKAGRWELNGEPIVFDENGVLKNGQHRLAAIITAGVTVDIAVVRGVSESVTAYDINSVRTVMQISNANGLDVSKNVLSAVSLLFYLAEGEERTSMKIVEYCRKHEAELSRTWRCMLNGKNTKNVNRGSLVLAAYLMLTLQKMPFYEVEVFFKAFANNSDFGTDGYEVSPALVARRMFDERYSKGSCQRTQREQLDIIIQALKDLHDNKKRTNSYKISSPFSFEPLIQQIMKEA